MPAPCYNSGTRTKMRLSVRYEMEIERRQCGDGDQVLLLLFSAESEHLSRTIWLNYGKFDRSAIEGAETRAMDTVQEACEYLAKALSETVTWHGEYPLPRGLVLIGAR